MKKRELTIFRKKEAGDLKKMLKDKKFEAYEVYSKTQIGQEKNPKKYLSLRREIAQILTILREKEILDTTSDFLLEKESGKGDELKSSKAKKRSAEDSEQKAETKKK